MSRSLNPPCPGTTQDGEPCKLRALNGRDACRHHIPYDGPLVLSGVVRCVQCRRPWPCKKAGT